MTKTLALLLTFFLCISLSHGQDDHLTKQFTLDVEAFNKSKSGKAQQAYTIYKKYIYELHDSILNIGVIAHEAGILANDERLIEISKLMIGSYYVQKGNGEISKYYLESTIPYFSKNKLYNPLAIAMNQIGCAYTLNGEYKIAIDWFIKSIQTAKKVKDYKSVHRAHLNIADVYLKNENLAEAERELKILERRLKTEPDDHALMNCYVYLGKLYQYTDIEKAVYYFEKSFELALKNNKKRVLGHAYTNMAIAYFEQEDTEKALLYFRKAHQIRLKVNNPIHIADSYYNLGDWHFYSEKYDSAIYYYNASYTYSKNHQLERQNSEALFALSQAYKANNDQDNAYKFLMEYIRIYKEQVKKNKKMEIDFLQSAYIHQQNEKLAKQQLREDEITDQFNKEQIKNKLLLFTIIAIIVIVLTSYILKSEKKPAKAPNTTVKPKDTAQQHIQIERNSLDFEHPFVKISKSLLISNRSFQHIHLGEDTIVIWENTLSNLENNTVRNNLLDKFKFSVPYDRLIKTLMQQSFFDTDRNMLCILSKCDDRFLISGINGLCIHDRDNLSLLTLNPVPCKNFQIVVSQTSKETLLQTDEWEKLIELSSFSKKMSNVMCLQNLNQQRELNPTLYLSNLFVLKIEN